MRDSVIPPMKPVSEGFDSLHAPRLSPAEGLESASSLFTAPPIEALELLRELGEIAAASISEMDTSAVEVTTAEPVAEAQPLPVPPPAEIPVTADPPTSDSRLLEALLEYHRLRGPKLGARTAPRPSSETNFARADASSESGERFSSIQIPVIQDVEPKTRAGGTILKPKPRS